MKCKSWSNKLNNFVVRRLKSVKVNTQQPALTSATEALQQQQQNSLQKEISSSSTTTATTTTTTTTQQQQYLQQYQTNYGTMPAMSKESNYTELKLKELSTTAQQQSSAPTKVVASPEPTATAPSSVSTMATTAATNHRLQQQKRSTCGCGGTAAANNYADLENSQRQSSTHNLLSGSSRYLTNGHPSPLAAAVAASSQNSSPASSSSSRAINCCRYQNNSQQAARESSKSSSRNTCSTSPPSQPAKKTPNDFIFGKFIGEGSFSNVYLGVEIATKREYAIKVCGKRHIIRENKQEYVRREREVMHILSNVPGFVNLACTFQDYRNLFFVMTYAKNGDLLPFINKVGSFDVDCTRHYAAELLLACEEMHKRNIVHRDLKPENILLDENMHTLIADFGSAKIMTPEERALAESTLVQAALDGVPPFAASLGEASSTSSSSLRQSRSLTRTARISDDDEEDEDTEETGSDEIDSPSREPTGGYRRKRCGSFVGTAQYVSPEVLQNGPITPMADLWALGCIIYQMISGLPPFRGGNEFFIFKEILACNLEFPEGFDSEAEDLVKKLLKINPVERLGAFDENGCYTSIRSHPFFAGIDFETIRTQTPPPICPNLPGVKKGEEFLSKHHPVPENMYELEPGLDDKQLNRLLGMELGCALGSDEEVAINTSILSSEAPHGSRSSTSMNKDKKKTVSRNPFDLSDEEKRKRLEEQKSDKWHVFADNEVILKKGYVNKRKGLFARKRMLLLTTGPRLIYIDPVQMIKKGEIPWSQELRVEPKNFKIFFVYTPNRTYYLDDPEGFALEWVDSIEKMRALTYPNQFTNQDYKITTTSTTYVVTNTTTTPTSSQAITTSSSSAPASSSSVAASAFSSNLLLTPTTITSSSTTTTTNSSPPHQKQQQQHQQMNSLQTSSMATPRALKTASN